MQKNALISLLFQDVRNENETKKGAVLLRLYAIIMCIYLLAVLLLCVGVDKLFILSATIPCFGLYCLSMYMTYYSSTGNASKVAFVTTLLWIFSMTYLLGLECGVQHLLFVLVAFCFILNTHRQKLNLFAALLLCMCRIGIYFYGKANLPYYNMDGMLTNVLQVLNTIIIFIVLVVMIGAFSINSSEMDRKLVAYNEKLEELAAIDPLTGLRNRRSTLQYIERCAKQYQSGASAAMSMAIGDIDHFKQVNDTYGHENGDLVLQHVSRIFSEFMKGQGNVGRWGGEEFLFVFPGLNGDEAMIQLSKLQKQIRNMPSVSKQENITVTMTWGLEEYSETEGITETINKADKKLYIGKKAGRDRIIY